MSDKWIEWNYEKFKRMGPIPVNGYDRVRVLFYDNSEDSGYAYQFRWSFVADVKHLNIIGYRLESSQFEEALLESIKQYKNGETTNVNVGVKHDSDKPDYTLIPKEAFDALAQCLGYGAQKYGRNNYQNGLIHSRLVAAAMRHLVAISSGEAIDNDSGLSHASHAMANCAMLIWMMKHKPDFNDLEG